MSNTDELQCVVEHHLDTAQLAAKKSTVRSHGFDMLASAAEPTGRSVTGTCAGAAILSRKSMCLKNLDSHLLQRVIGAEQMEHCRWQAALLRLKGSTILIITSYLTHSIGLAAENLVLLEQLLVLIKAVGLPVIMCADWQMHPSMLIESDWPRRANLVLAEPPGQKATCNINLDKASYLDFFLVSPQLLPLVTVEPFLSAPWKTHLSLRLTLHARPHQFMAPIMRIPKKLPALPLMDGKHIFLEDTWKEAERLAQDHISKHAPISGVIGLGPHLLQKLPHAQQSLSKDFALASTKAECYTCLAAKIPQDQIHRFLGRGHMPSVVVKSPFQRNYGSSKFHCRKCDTWTRLETVLTWLTGAQLLTNAHLSKCVLDMRRMLPDIEFAWEKIRKHGCPLAAWSSWISNLTAGGLSQQLTGYTGERVQVWLQRAIAQKQHAINERVKNARRGFKSWLYSSLKQGAAVAHAYVKADGKPPPVSPFDLNSIFNNWGTLWQNTRPQEISADPKMLITNWSPWRQQVEQCVDSNLGAMQDDHAFFQKSSRKSFSSSASGKISASEGDQILDFGLDEFVAAVKAYPSRKKPGSDTWQSDELKVLPPAVLHPFARVLNGVQRNAFWPIQLLLNLGSLIAKPSGDGQRPISKTPMFYRIWNIIRSAKLREWGAAHCPGWDTASPGKSAETEACARLWLMEVASLSENEAAALLWDLEKFYDTISPEEVRRAAVRHDYPLTELKLALAMHKAPRILQMIGVSASVILPGRSILQGCFHSFFFARLLLWAPMQRCISDLSDLRSVDKTVAQVNNSTFVDDVAQLCIGKSKHVKYALAVAGVSFISSVRQYKLVISSKSLVVASDLRIARTIASAICDQTSVKVHPCTAGRDLGVQLVATGRRSTVLQRKRIAKTIGKLKRIAPLARKIKGARKLIATGALPQCMWGSASIGLSPTRVKELRVATAAACGIGGKGRCASTAIAIGIGPDKDPAVMAVTRQASVFIDVWRTNAQVRALSLRYWSSALQRVIVSNVSQWNAVRSTMSATIAAFHDQGWKLPSPVVWQDPKGQEWHADFTAAKAPFIRLVAGHAQDRIWAEAASFHDGKGLQHGVHWQSTLALHRRLSKSSAIDGEEQELLALEEEADQLPITSLSWLELFLTGGFWPNDRAYKAGIGVEPKCPRCGCAKEDSLHFFWLCPKNSQVLDPRVKSTQTLLSQAVDGSTENPCLWLRGMLPLSLLHINTPFSETSQLRLVGSFIQPFMWPSGEYFSDASGGQHNSFPVIRRCGFGVVLLRDDFSEERLLAADDPSELTVFGAYGVLPGFVHTVPRAELYAILEIANNLAQYAVATITSDSKINVDMYESGEEQAKRSANGDLWESFYEVVERNFLKIRLRWAKGHASLDVVDRYQITTKDACGNMMADSLAERAASEHEVYAEDAFATKWHIELVSRIQKRAVVLLNLYGLRKPDSSPKESGTKLPRIPVSGQMLASQHSFTCMGRRLFCYRCHQSSPTGVGAAQQWLKTPCNPDRMLMVTYTAGTVRPTRFPAGSKVKVGNAETHPSHKLCVHKGLFFCRECACYATKKLENLAKPCDPTRGKGLDAANRKRSAAISLLQGKLPRGVAAFPNSAEKFLQLAD